MGRDVHPGAHWPSGCGVGGAGGSRSGGRAGRIRLSRRELHPVSRRNPIRGRVMRDLRAMGDACVRQTASLRPGLYAGLSNTR